MNEVLQRKHIIWTSELESIDKIEDESMTDAEKLQELSFQNELWYEDEMANLNIELAHPIIVIADLGLWYGRVPTFKILKNNINSILGCNCGSTETITYYSDGYNIRAEDSHHDGTNRYLFREIRNPDNIGNLMSKIINKEPITSKTINYYTKTIAPHVNRVYGWGSKYQNKSA